MTKLALLVAFASLLVGLLNLRIAWRLYVKLTRMRRSILATRVTSSSPILKPGDLRDTTLLDLIEETCPQLRGKVRNSSGEG